MQFSILVVRLSMIIASSSSVISSCIFGPRYDGGNDFTPLVDLLDGTTSIPGPPSLGEPGPGLGELGPGLGEPGPGLGEPGEEGSVEELADIAERASSRNVSFDNSTTWSMSIWRGATAIEGLASLTSAFARRSSDSSSLPARHFGYKRCSFSGTAS